MARALISVTDKTGVIELASGLAELGVEIISTGGTAERLQSAGVQVRRIEQLTGFPEMMDGRVKTLHPKLYGALLARRDDEGHLGAAREHSIEQIDLVCVNLYPFEQTIEKHGVSDAEAIENIDIGGPTMVRAAAKNGDFVVVLVDPADYEGVLSELRERDGRVCLESRRRLAGKAFALTARYDAAIADWFARRARETAQGGQEGITAQPEGEEGLPEGGQGQPQGGQEQPQREEGLPQRVTQSFELAMRLRYGENPHQRGAYYVPVDGGRHLLSGTEQLQGRELSYNNLLDLAAAKALAFDFEEPCCVIVKHNNPCGCALGRDALEAYERALACDPQSAFGGVIAVNRELHGQAAEAICRQFVEVLLAQGFDEDALQLLSGKKNLRLLDVRDGGTGRFTTESRPLAGGLLLQDTDVISEQDSSWTQMTARAPSEQERADMMFAWRVCMRVRSNAIVIAKDRATIGIGAGQMSRVDSVAIALEKARQFQREALSGSSLASDAFFPFPDGPELAMKAGVSAIIQPGGSVKDAEVIAAANAAGVAMAATGVRHFRH